MLVMAAYKHIKGTPHGGLAAKKPEGTYGHRVLHKVASGISVKGSNGGLSHRGHDFFAGKNASGHVSIKGGQNG